MKHSENADLTCGRCGHPVRGADTYCMNCGALFVDSLRCSVHPVVEAEGVCVICAKPFCKECGGESDKIFRCDAHFAEYEIQEGMARVFGSTDNVQAQYVTSCLTQAGLHPFLYSRLFNPGADLVAITGPRNFGRHPVVELKVLVPFAEALEARKRLRQMKLIT